MAYVPYIPDTDKWTQHFVNMAERSQKPQDFYIVRSQKTGSGESPVIMVSPVQQDVARAKSDLKTDFAGNKSLESLQSSQSAKGRRADNVKKVVQKYKKTNK